MPSHDVQVVLIGGAPGAGKSTLGRAVASKLGYASLTVDDLLVTAVALTTEESHPEFHQVSRVGHLRYFTDGPKEKLISDSLAQEAAMWPVLERVISSHINKDSPVAIDWWLLRPRTVAALDNGQVVSVWLHIDPEALWERERENTDWMEGSADKDRMLANFMHRSLWRNDLVAEEAGQLGMMVLNITGLEPIDELANSVLETIGVHRSQ
ncbi:MAG: AAA family ATPase [Actinomycetota bacterium]